MQNAVLKCIYSRRSVRRYLDKRVEKELTQELLNAAVMAPSARNTQPWHFSIVENQDAIKRYSDIVIQQWNALGKGVQLGKKITGLDPVFYKAPLLIFISGKRNYKYLKDDINLAVQNMFLAAHSLDLGSCWIGFAKVLDKDKEVREELNVPDDFQIVAPLIFGYPKKLPTKIPEREPKILNWVK